MQICRNNHKGPNKIMYNLQRIIIFIIAIFFSGFGIALSTQANLGTTPISSLPYVLTFITPMSFGTTTILINIIFLIIQIIILKKDFKKIDYLQLPVTLFFGIFIDIGMHIASYCRTNIYLVQLLTLIAGSAILALGITLEVYANLLYVPGEGVVKAFSRKYNKNFGTTKIIFDISLCIISIILSLLVLGKVQGLREGTVYSAVLVGGFVWLYYKLWTFFKCPNKNLR